MTKVLPKFGHKQLQVIKNYMCGFNQSEMGKYFELIIIIIIMSMSMSSALQINFSLAVDNM